MKLFASTVAALLCSVSAFAADLPSRKAATAAPAANESSWTGYYIGADLGWKFGDFNAFDNQVNLLQSEVTTLLARPVAIDKTGGSQFSGGLYGGYNYQFDKFVTGVEADLNLGSITRSAGLDLTGNGHTVTGNLSQASQVGGSFRGRFGYNLDMFMPYVTGGVAVASNKFSGTAALDGVAVPGLAISATKQQFGYVLGGGLEYKVSANVIGRVEYLYTNFAPTQFGGTVAKFGTSTNQVRAGLSYKF